MPSPFIGGYHYYPTTASAAVPDPRLHMPNPLSHSNSGFTNMKPPTGSPYPPYPTTPPIANNSYFSYPFTPSPGLPPHSSSPQPYQHLFSSLPPLPTPPFSNTTAMTNSLYGVPPTTHSAHTLPPTLTGPMIPSYLQYYYPSNSPISQHIVPTVPTMPPILPQIAPNDQKSSVLPTLNNNSTSNNMNHITNANNNHTSHNNNNSTESFSQASIQVATTPAQSSSAAVPSTPQILGNAFPPNFAGGPPMIIFLNNLDSMNQFFSQYMATMRANQDASNNNINNNNNNSNNAVSTVAITPSPAIPTVPASLLTPFSTSLINTNSTVNNNGLSTTSHRQAGTIETRENHDSQNQGNKEQKL